MLALYLLLLAAPVRVLLTTSLGEIEMELQPDRAPVTVANFLHYVERGSYDGGRFHRTVTLHPDNQPANRVKIEVVQATVRQSGAGNALPPIALERTSATKLRHTNGVVSMARGGPDSATVDFFICIGNQPSLDYGGRRNPDGQGFAAFGRVVRGMDVVRRIQASPAKGQSLTPPVEILKARLVK